MLRTLTLGLILVGGAALAPPARADGPPAAPPKLGKFVLVYYQANNTHQVIPVKRPEIQVVGTKTFLTGVGAKIDGAPMFGAGRPVWINVDNLQMMYHFDSLDEMTKEIRANLPGKDH